MEQTVSFRTCKQIFEQYASRYDRTDGRVELKIIHTNHVVAIMEQLCKERCLDPHLTNLALICAQFHDIGRFEQITAGTPHHTAGAYLAGVILPKCGFTEEETARIQRAIENHRQEDTPGGDTLSRWLYRADKLSRNCFCCAAAPLCNWPDTKKNHGISC